MNLNVKSERRGDSVDGYSPGSGVGPVEPNANSTSSTGYGDDRIQRKTTVDGLGLISAGGDDEQAGVWDGMSNAGESSRLHQHRPHQAQRNQPPPSSTTDFFDFDLGGHGGMDPTPGPSSFSNPPSVNGSTHQHQKTDSPRDWNSTRSASHFGSHSHSHSQSQSQTQELAGKPDWTMHSEESEGIGAGSGFDGMGIEGLDGEVGQELQRQVSEVSG